jgi:hypothetical protein
MIRRWWRRRVLEWNDYCGKHGTKKTFILLGSVCMQCINEKDYSKQIRKAEEIRRMAEQVRENR